MNAFSVLMESVTGRRSLCPPKSPKIIGPPMRLQNETAGRRSLTLKQRYTQERMPIECLLAQKQSKTKIAQTIGVTKSTVYREVQRNCDERSGGYKSDLAQRKCQTRHQQKPKQLRFAEQIKERTEELLRQDFSPEQVVGYCQKNQQATVSHETIYQYIWQDKKAKGTLHSHLRHQGRKYRKRGAYKDCRGMITHRVDIDQRPQIVEQKKRFAGTPVGDLEVDTIIGKNHQGAIVTLNDRATGMLKMQKADAAR